MEISILGLPISNKSGKMNEHNNLHTSKYFCLFNHWFESQFEKWAFHFESFKRQNLVNWYLNSSSWLEKPPICEKFHRQLWEVVTKCQPPICENLQFRIRQLRELTVLTKYFKPVNFVRPSTSKMTFSGLRPTSRQRINLHLRHLRPFSVVRSHWLDTSWHVNSKVDKSCDLWPRAIKSSDIGWNTFF